MFSLYICKKLFSIKKFVSNSTPFHPHEQVLHAQSLLRGFDNYVSVSYFSSITSVKNEDLSEVPKKAAKRVNKPVERRESGLVQLQQVREERALTVSYLEKSLGFSPESARRACVRVRLKDLEKADSIVALFRKYGLSTKHIATVVRRRLPVLAGDEQDIANKLEFFRSVGVSSDILGAMVAKDPSWLLGNLDDAIIPNYNFIKSILLTDEIAIGTIKNNLWLLWGDIETKSSPNIKVLKELKVPESNIRYLVRHYPETLFLYEEFEESVNKVLGMEFNPLKVTFVLALHAISGKSNKAIWERCYETYSKWGWTEEDIYMAFRNHPNCMIMSQKKINGVMEFLVNRIGMEPKKIAQRSAFILLSLEKRIIPRFSVMQVLLSEQLIDYKVYNLKILKMNEKQFLRMFVARYKKEVPELYDIYKGEIKVVEIDI